MKKYLLTGLIALVLLIPTIGASTTPFTNNMFPTPAPTSDFTHTVFAEYASTTSCGNCPAASAALYSIFQSADYPFYYVSLVADKNDVAKNRCGHYYAKYVPSVYFDGGAKNVTGAVGESNYRSLIQQCGQRTVHSLGIQMTATGGGNGQITITIKVKNNGSFFYIGGLITYVTEIVSRWQDAKGNPYHYACLDMVKKPLFLFPKGSRTFTVNWDGAGKGFGDINDGNIKIISSVSHWKPHPEVGYEDSKFIAFYVDQTAGVAVS
jgi:hypothetical protein